MQNTFWYFYVLSVLLLGVQPLNCLYSPQFEYTALKGLPLGMMTFNTKELKDMYS